MTARSMLRNASRVSPLQSVGQLQPAAPRTRLNVSTTTRRTNSTVSFRKPGARRRTGPETEGGESARPSNPLDDVRAYREAMALRAKNIRQFKWLVAGTVLSMATPLIIIQFYELPEEVEQRKKKEAVAAAKRAARGDDAVPAAGAGRVERADAGDKDADDRFQGKKIEIKSLGDKVVAADALTGMEIGELVPTGTSNAPYLPKAIHLPTTSSSETLSETLPAGTPGSKEEEYTLLGHGIRTVSFLGIQVYVVGLYVRTSDLANLQAAIVKRLNPSASALIPSEKEQLKKALLDPNDSAALWDALLRPGDFGIKTAVRITPTRNTDFSHLRDAFVRGITARSTGAPPPPAPSTLPYASAEGVGHGVPPPDNFDDEAFPAAVNDFKTLFHQRSRAARGSVVMLLRDGTKVGDGQLTMMFQPKQDERGAGPIETVGSVADERISRLIWLGYLGGKNVSSEPARKSIAEGVVKLVERPVGTVADARLL